MAAGATRYRDGMRLIGLSGGIATGKSTVAALLAAQGAAVVDADSIAREVVEPGTPALDQIRQRFGDSILSGDGRIDRAALGRRVFADAAERRTLEQITHPRITELMQQRIASALGSPAQLVVVDVPLLFENARQGLFEATMLVYAAPQVQLQRLRARDGLDEAEAQQRLAAQMPIDHKRALATWVIDNTGSRHSTASQVADWWHREVQAQRSH